MKRLRKYLALSPTGRAIVLRSLFLLPVVSLLLKARGMKCARAWLRRSGRFAGRTSEFAPGEIAALVGAAASLLQARCLPRSLVLCQLLRDRGSSAEIRLGVAKPADGLLSAHAWVEVDGFALNDGLDVDARYSVLPLRADRNCPNSRAPRLF